MTKELQKPRRKRILFSSYLLRNDMTSQATPRGHHPGRQRGEVLCTRPRLGAPSYFQCQAKTAKGNKNPDIYEF
jgi:hypothetical protein